MSNLQSNSNTTQTGGTGVRGISGQQSGMGTTTSSTGTGGGGDMLDKSIDFLERKAGHEQSRSTTEKISDGLRKGIQKVTGKDLPIADKDYSQDR